MAKITIYGKSRTTKDGRGKFVVYDCVTKSGMWYNVKFTNGCPNRPMALGYVDIEVDKADLSVSKKKIVTENGEEKTTKTLWVRRVISSSENKARNDELALKRQEEIADILDE